MSDDPRGDTPTMSEPHDGDRRRKEDLLPISRVSFDFGCQPLLSPDIAEHLSEAERAAFFCSLVDATIDAIIAHRMDGSIIYANRGTSELLGYSPQELLELEPWGWVAPSQVSGAPKRIDALVHEGRLVFQSACRRKDGTTLPTEVTSRRVDTSLGPIVVAVMRDTSDRTQAEERLHFLAFHDGLTRVGNRARLDERMALALANAKRYGDLLALAYIDLDEFKPINDRYGHDVGDEVLIEIGRRLRDSIREQDTVARLGGDEFVILVPRLLAAEELPKIAERVVARIEEPIFSSGHTLRVKASIGLALFDAATDDARTLLVKSDVAMYAAKQDPLHPWLLYDRSMGRVDQDRAE